MMKARNQIAKIQSLNVSAFSDFSEGHHIDCSGVTEGFNIVSHERGVGYSFVLEVFCCT